MNALIKQPKYVSDDIFDHVIKKTKSQLKVLNNVYKNDIEKETLFSTICDIVCGYFKTNMDEVREFRMCRNREYMIIRQMLVYFLVEYLYPHIMTKVNIGKKLKYSHSTVIHHHEEVQSMLEIGDRQYIKMVSEIGRAIDETR